MVNVRYEFYTLAFFFKMGTITANEAEFTNASNLKIFYRTWQAEKDGNEWSVD